ncbi:hypothetical protein ACLKA6_015724 [Drosophila palustris]
MNVTLAICLFSALCCGLSLAKDYTGSTIYKDGSEVPFTAFFINPRSIQRTSLGQGRHIGSGLNWNLGEMSFKDYLFPKRNADKEDKESVADFDVENVENIDTEADPHQHSHHYPFYPFSPYFNTGYPFAGYPYPYYPYDPYAAFQNPGYQFPGFPYPISNSGKSFPMTRKLRKYRN